jgi:prepilin-type N-terminal cleavage/methylation domain-containing protein
MGPDLNLPENPVIGIEIAMIRKKWSFPMKNKCGYTFIEVMIALGILAVMIVLSLSVGRSIAQKSSITSVVNQFMADFNYAKQLASLENRYVTVIFNADGCSYQIRTQNTVGDLGNWTVAKTVEPLEGKECFNGSAVQNFAVNSLGEVFHFPIASSMPAPVTLTFYVMYTPQGVIDYQKNVKIYPYGGIHAEK